MFSQHSRTLASVPRWSVVPVIRRQYVAEHSYYVSLYTAELLGLPIFDNWTHERKFMALRYAIIHDAAEARMADTPGPVKRLTVDRPKFDKLEAEVVTGMGFNDKFGLPWYGAGDDAIKAVVKVADLIDEYFYLTMEAAFGSRVIARLSDQVDDRLYAAILGLPWGPVPLGHVEHPEARALWTTINSQGEEILQGIETLTNNDDVCSDKNRCGMDTCPVCDGIPF